jgi:TPR repeat
VRWSLPALLVLLVAGAGCQQAPTSAPRTDSATPSVDQLRAEGDARFKRGDYEGAVRAYEQALLYDPQNVELRYLAGVALARAGRANEATAAFLWVVDHGHPDNDEVRLARQWLAEAGLKPVSGRPSSGDGAAAPGDPGPAGQLKGRTQWSGLDPARRPNLQILLEGEEPATRGRRYWAKVPLNEPYEIAGIVPGRYRVMAQVGPVRLWDTTVEIKPESPTLVDLTPSTSVAPPEALAQVGLAPRQ